MQQVRGLFKTRDLSSLIVRGGRGFSARVMRAITVDPLKEKDATPDDLRVEEVPLPEVGEGECLIKVRATAVNRADILQR